LKTPALLCLLSLSTSAVSQPADSEHSSRADSDLKVLYLSVMEQAVDSFEPLWTEQTPVPRAGFWDFRRQNNWVDNSYAALVTLPGTGMVVLDYAVLLRYTGQAVFGKAAIPRKTLQERCTKALRWAALTSAYVPHPYPYLEGNRAEFASGRQWQRVTNYRADVIGYLTLAAAVLWLSLDEETRGLFCAMARGTAQKGRAATTWAAGQGGNHDQVKKNLASTLGAAYLCPACADSASYMSAVTADGIDLVSTLQDRTRPEVVANERLSHWAAGANLYEDYSSDHHGKASVWYGVDALFEGRCFVQLVCTLAGRPVPATFTFPGNGFEGVVEWAKDLSLRNGALLHPHGAEYDSYYGEGVLPFCFAATVMGDKSAGALEAAAARQLQRHTSAVREYDYHRGSSAKAAIAFLMHQYRRSPAPVNGDGAQRLGTRHYSRQRFLLFRDAEKLTAFSWGSTSSTRRWKQEAAGMGGLVVPDRSLDEEPLIYSHPSSLVGRVVSESIRGAAARFTSEWPWHLKYRLLVPPVERYDRLPATWRAALIWAGSLLLAVGLAAGFLSSGQRWFFTKTLFTLLGLSGLLTTWVALGSWYAGESPAARKFGVILGALALAAFLVDLRLALRGSGKRCIKWSAEGVGVALAVVVVGFVVTAVVQDRVSDRLLASRYTYHAREDRLSTAGTAEWRDVRGYLSFVSFAGGPVVRLTVLVAQRDTVAEWQGVPVYFYSRNGVTGDRHVQYAQGSGLLVPTVAPSRWWPVNDKIGAVSVSGGGGVRVWTEPGFNWARSEAYRDKAVGVSLDGSGPRKVKAGGLVADSEVVIYANRTAEEIRKASLEALPVTAAPGWRGVIAPAAAREHIRYLALSNLFGAEDNATVALTAPEGGPVLSIPGYVTAATARIPVHIGHSQTLAEQIEWYVKADGEGVLCRRLDARTIELTPHSASATVRVEYWGSSGNLPQMVERDARTRAILTRWSGREHELHLKGDTVVEASPIETDRVGPAVSVEAENVPAEGVVKAHAWAGDHSGISRIVLLCDGNQIDESTRDDITATIRLMPGWHVFRARAFDASPARNVTESFQSVIEVPGRR